MFGATKLLAYRHGFLLRTGAFTLLLFFLMPPGSISTLGNGWFKHAFIAGALISISISALLYLYRIKIDLLGGLGIAYALAMLTSCLLNGGDIVTTIFIHWPIAATLLLARAVTPAYKREFLWAILILTTGYSTANLISICLVPVGTPHLHPDVGYSFLGHRNSACRSYLLALIASFLIDSDKGRRFTLRTIALVGIALAHSVVAYSATSLLALVALLIGIALISNVKLRKYLNAFTYVVAYFVAFFSVVVFRVQYNFSPLLEAILGKNASFTGRTDIWDKAISLLNLDHLLFGYHGTTEPLLVINGTLFGTAHNTVLNDLLWGGIVTLAIVWAIIGLTALHLFRQRSSYTAALLALAIGIYLLMGLSEFITCVSFFIVLGLGFSWDAEPNKRS